MARRLRITAGSVQALASLDGSATADAIWGALPLAAPAQTWGDEIYFRIPVALEEVDAREVVSAGDLAYWPPGHAFCLFFGPTPASHGREVRAASPVNVFGRLEGDPTIFRAVPDGTRVRLTRVDDVPAPQGGQS